MENINENQFWNATLDELSSGCIETENAWICLICQESFEKGRIYEKDNKFYESKRALHYHIEEKHGSALEYYMNMNTSYSGITEVQKDVIALIAKGLSDKEIARTLGVADSTIRNHRFKLREKEKQAKVFLTIMNLLNQSEAVSDSLAIHKSATAIDERYNINEKETESVLKTYFDDTGALKKFPAKEKRKIIVLREIMKSFTAGKKYSEPEINKMLGRIYEDYPTLRRYLIEYGFLDRTKDCSTYWVKA